MRLDIAWWELEASPQTVETLHEHLHHGAVQPWEHLPGLRLKLWIADHEHNRWGAVMLWQTDRPAPHELPPNTATDLIGYPPTHRYRFEVQAMADPHTPHHPAPGARTDTDTDTDT